VLVVIDRNVDLAERVSEFARWRIGLAEVNVEDGGTFDAAEALILPVLRALPPVAMAFVVRIGLAITAAGASPALTAGGAARSAIPSAIDPPPGSRPA